MSKLMKRWKNRLAAHLNSIQFNIAMSFGLFILVVIVTVGMISYNKFAETLEKNAEEYNVQLIEQVKENIDYYIQHMVDISSVIQTNQNVQQYLSTPIDESAQLVQEQENNLMELLKSLVSIRNDIVSIFIFGYGGQLLVSNPELQIKDYAQADQQDWYKKAQLADGQVVVSSSHVNTILKNPRWAVSLSKEIEGSHQGDKKGILLIDLNYRVIEEICRRVKLGEQGYIFIINDQGSIVYHPEQQLIYNQLKTENISMVMNATGRSFSIDSDGGRQLYTIANSESTGWKVVSVTNINDIMMSSKESRDFFVLVIIISILLASAMSIVISTRISKPIKQLELSMKQVEKGNFDIELEIKYKHEVGRLSHKFNIMTRKIKELMQQLLEEQKTIRKSEMKVLQSQINPHFLYNTLDSIIWMAEYKKYEEVVEMTSALAKLFRISLNKGNEIITIREEVEHVRNYLVIQQMRYTKKLDFIIDVDREILACDTIKLILQPLVENAIYHGIKNIERKGLIQILGAKINDTMVLQVVDNGIGMTQKQVESIYSDATREHTKGNGVGVRNVQERLQLYYGQAYGLSFQSEINQGTTVSITIPYLK